MPPETRILPQRHGDAEKNWDAAEEDMKQIPYAVRELPGRVRDDTVIIEGDVATNFGCVQRGVGGRISIIGTGSRIGQGARRLRL